MPTQSKSKAVEVRTVELTPAGTIPADAIREAVKTGSKIRLDLDKSDIAAAMLERKLSATSVEGLGSSGELDEIDAIFGQAVQVNGAGFRNSDDQYLKGEGSLGIYTVLNVVTLSGEMLTVGTGALDVVVTACKILELDLLGSYWVIAPAKKETEAGYTPLNMTPATTDKAGEPF